jgi:hypothetical protein
MKNIRWDASDIEALAKRSFLIRKHAISPMSPLEAVRRAQDEVLKPNQRRELTGMHQVQKVVDAWKILEAQGYGDREQAIQPVTPPQYQQVQLKLADVSTADLLDEFMKRLAPVLDPEYIRSLAREEANKVLEARIPNMLLQPDDIHVEGEEGDKKDAKQYHVCVLGLEGNQKESLRREYGSLIDFHFMDGSEGVNRIKATCERMDLTVRSRWCKGNLGSTSGWPKFSSAEGGGMDTIKRLINQHFKL